MVVNRDRQLTPSYGGSWRRRLTSLEGIPLDIMYLVADHSSVEDLVALSIVSEPLQDLLSDRGIWKKLYRRSTLFLPPGPYEWQSTSYLINVLLRAKKFHSLWPPSGCRPQILRIRYMNFGCDATLSVLLGRWLFVAEGSTLVCYDSHCRNIPESAKTLFDTGASRRILRVFTVGSVGEEGILAFAVIFLKDSFTIAKVIMDRGQPSEIQTILTSTPIVVEGWTDLVDVQLYHRLLMVNIGECSSDWESSGRLVIMDIDTLRRYHIPASTDDAMFDPMHTITFFLATKTHFIKVIEFNKNYEVQSNVECFPIPIARETPGSDILYPSHQGRVDHSLRMRECTVIHESPIDFETGKISFTLCGLGKFPSDGSTLGIMEVCLDPDGSVSLEGFGVSRYPVTSLCIGLRRQHGCGVALTTDKRPLVFVFDYHGRFVSFKFSTLNDRFPESEIIALDAFGGTAFLFRRSSHHTFVEVADFTRGAQKVEGICWSASSGEMLDGQQKTCRCWQHNMSGEVVYVTSAF